MWIGELSPTDKKHYPTSTAQYVKIPNQYHIKHTHNYCKHFKTMDKLTKQSNTKYLFRLLKTAKWPTLCSFWKRHSYPAYMPNFSGHWCFGQQFYFLHHWSHCNPESISWCHNHFFNYDIKKLIMMQKFQPRTVGLKPTTIGHVDRVNYATLTTFLTTSPGHMPFLSRLKADLGFLHHK